MKQMWPTLMTQSTRHLNTSGMRLTRYWFHSLFPSMSSLEDVRSKSAEMQKQSKWNELLQLSCLVQSTIIKHKSAEMHRVNWSVKIVWPIRSEIYILWRWIKRKGFNFLNVVSIRSSLNPHIWIRGVRYFLNRSSIDAQPVIRTRCKPRYHVPSTYVKRGFESYPI